MRPPALRLGVFVPSFLLLLSLSPLTFAQTITVTSANPNNAPQGTVNLNVLINGKGFKKGALSKFFITGTTDPGGIAVNSTSFISSGQLNANINVAANATPTQFDIIVTMTDGRSGKGTKLFAVTVPDPAIAYTAGYQNRADLVVMNADGTNQMTILSQQLVGNDAPVWSPDGAQLAFSRFSKMASQVAIYVVNKDGSGLRKVIDYNSTASYKISWSPVPLADGNYKIAFSDCARLPDGSLRQDSDMFMVNTDGTGLVQLTDTPDVREWDVTWSPTADRIAVYAYNYVIDNGMASLPVYSVNYGPGGFTATQLYDLMAVPGSPFNGDFSSPAWAKTQDKIAVSARIPGTTYRIWVFDLADPANPVDLTPAPNTFSWRPSWSPDDSKILFLQNYARGPFGIWVINPDGSGAKEIAVPINTFTYNYPDWRRCGPTGTIACAP